MYTDVTYIVQKMYILVTILGFCLLTHGAQHIPESQSGSANGTGQFDAIGPTLTHQQNSTMHKETSTETDVRDSYIPNVYDYPAIGGKPVSSFVFDDFDEAVDPGLTSLGDTGSPSDEIRKEEVGLPHEQNVTGASGASDASEPGANSRNNSSYGHSNFSIPVTQSRPQEDNNALFEIGGRPVSAFKFEDFREDYLTQNASISRTYNSSTPSQSHYQSSTGYPDNSSLTDVPNKVQSAGQFLSNFNHNTNEERFDDHDGSNDRAIPAIGGKPVLAFNIDDITDNLDSRRNASSLGQTSTENRPQQWRNHSINNKNQLPTVGSLGNTTSKPANPYGGYASFTRGPIYTFWFDDLRVFRPIIAARSGAGLSSEDIPYRVGTNITETNASVRQVQTVSIEKDWKPESTKSEGRERLPWQVSVFSKDKTPYVRICGGSLVSRVAVVSAAHCFWQEDLGLLPATRFAVGAGEILPYRTDDYSSYRQQNDVGTIKVPPDFCGAAGGFRADIAVVQLLRPLFQEHGLRPVCLSFDRELEAQQLVAGDLATTLGVGLQKENGLTVLQRLEVPYIAEEDCSKVVDQETLRFFTGDKICAGFKPGASPALGKICSIDAGAGLAFLSPTQRARSPAVPYLRGVASLSRACGAGGAALYTRVADHRALLEGAGAGAGGAGCQQYYPQAQAAAHVEGGQFVCNCYC